MATFIAEHRTAILTQSAMMLVSAVLMLGFFVSVSARLRGAGDKHGWAASSVLAAAVIWVALSFVAQALQIGVAQAAAEVSPPVLWTMGAVFAVANVPLGAALVVTGLTVLRTRAYAPWLGALSLAAAVAELTLSASAVVTSGPLAADGWLAFVLYPAFALWLVPMAIVLVRREKDETAVALPRRRELVAAHSSGQG